MSLVYLLDTNVLSELTKLSPDAGVVDRFEVHQNQCAMASVVWHELQFGVLRMPAGRKRNYLEDYLSQTVRPFLPCLPYDEVAAQWHAQERARLTALGLTPSYADGQIAAIAAVNELILVTHNQRDVQCFQGLQVESWMSSAQQD